VADNAATAQLKASVFDAFGNSVNNQAITYTFAVGHGTLDSPGGVSDNGYLVRTLRSDTTLDPAVPITVTVSKLANPVTGTIAFVVGPPDHVAVVASATAITVANPVGLQLTLYDKSSHVLPNVPLTITSSLGTISPGATNTTNSGGQVALQLLSTRAGVATLTAASFNGAVAVIGHKSITFTADVPTQAVLQALPTAIVADGLSTAVITVTVTDIYANPVAGVNPTLTTTEGTLSGSGLTGSNGITTRTLKSTTVITTAVIDVDGLNASPISVNFVTGPVYSVTMTASPDTASVEGEGIPDQIAANFSVTDKVGHPLVNQTVSLTSTFGSRMKIACNTAVNGRAVTNAYGQFSCNLKSTQSGTPDIYVDGIKAVATSFQFLPGPEVRVEVYPAHTTFGNARKLAAGTPFLFTAMAFDTYNNPISSITNFSWEVQPSAPLTDFRLGGGSISNGLFVGQKTGYVMIIAAVGGSIGYSYVEVLGRPTPTQAQLTATPKTTPIEPPSGGVIQLSIKVMDSYGNAIGAGFIPVVTTTIGAAEGTGSTNGSGVAASSIRSTVAGQATLNVTNLLTVTGDTTVNFTVGKPSKVRVISSKTRLHANGTETADLTVQALDYYNNPVAAGYRLNIVTPPGTVSCPLGDYTNASGVVSCILTSATTEATVNFSQIPYNGVPLTLTPDSTTVEFYVGLLRDIVFSPTLPITVTAGVPVTVTANGYDAERAQVPPAQLTYSWSQYPPEHAESPPMPHYHFSGANAGHIPDSGDSDRSPLRR
jgi:adhesin/invasin